MNLMPIVGCADAGLIVSIGAVGGDSLTTTLPLLFFSVALLTAGGTDFWFAASTKLFATLGHHCLSLIK